MENKETAAQYCERLGITEQDLINVYQDNLKRIVDGMNSVSETTDKIPTEKKFISKWNVAFEDLEQELEFEQEMKKDLEEYRNYHLTKQAEVIAEKAQAYCDYNDNPQVGKGSILQASEDYKQSVK